MLRRAMEWLGGSVLVYAVVAACASMASDGVAGDAGGNAGSTSSNDDGGGGKKPGVMNPVPEADAAEDGERLKVMRVTSDDGLSAPTGTYWDSELNAECGRMTASDGQLRCLPFAAYSTGYYADSDCTQRTAAASGCSGSLAFAYEARRGSAGTCSTAFFHDVYRVEAALSAVYLKTGDQCQLVDDESELALAYYRISDDPVDPSTFAAMTVVHE